MKDRSEALDLVRGLAALFVMIGHLRSIFFVPFDSLDDKGIVNKLFYFVTGYGHECVMIFFVLSGYFVGAAYYRGFDPHNIRRPLISYGVNRMVRLWVVLIPALLFTALIDWTGLMLTPDEGVYSSGDYFDFIHPSNDRSATTFAGNIFFLQSILVPTFGTNTPLWSLANEFWYYLLFPIMFIAFRSRAILVRTMLIFVVAALLAGLNFFNHEIIEGFIIWLLGFGAYLVKWRANRMTRIIIIIVFLGVFAASRMEFPSTYESISIGLATALLILAIRDASTGKFGVVAVFLSRISYTLYLVHLPMIIFVAATLLYGVRFSGGLTGIAIFTGMCAALVAFSYLFYYLFERRTDDVRKVIKRFVD